MNCPECNSKAMAIDSRCDGSVTYRRFKCPKCAFRFSTIEQIVPKGIGLIKYPKYQAERERAKEQIDKIRASITELERICNER